MLPSGCQNLRSPIKIINDNIFCFLCSLSISLPEISAIPRIELPETLLIMCMNS